MLHQYNRYKQLDHVLTVCSHCWCADSSITRLKTVTGFLWIWLKESNPQLKCLSPSRNGDYDVTLPVPKLLKHTVHPYISVLWLALKLHYCYAVTLLPFLQNMSKVFPQTNFNCTEMNCNRNTCNLKWIQSFESLHKVKH